LQYYFTLYILAIDGKAGEVWAAAGDRRKRFIYWNGEQESFLPLTRKESLKAPLRVGEGFGEGSDPSLIDQQLHGIRPYKWWFNGEFASARF
jgi:hypothetical protein